MRLYTAWIGNDKAFSVNKVILYTFSRNSFIFDWVFIENILYLLSFIFKANYIHFPILSLNVYCNSFNFLHIGINSIIQPSQSFLLYESLNSSFSFILMIDHEVDSSSLLDIVDVLYHWIDFIELNVEIVFIVNKIYLEENQLYPTIHLVCLCH